MTDLEMTKLCAEAMGYRICIHAGFTSRIGVYAAADGDFLKEYDPLTNDAQAMALVKKFRLRVEPGHLNKDRWLVSKGETIGDITQSLVDSLDLNRAIAECVARMQKAKE